MRHQWPAATAADSSDLPADRVRRLPQHGAPRGQGDFFLNLENYVPAHPTVRNRQQEIDNLSAEIKNMSAIATEFLTEHKLKTNEVLNKHKITKQFRKYDYVFVLDRTQVHCNNA